MPFVQNFPFLSVATALFCGIVCLLLGKHTAKWLSLTCLASLTAMSAALLFYTAGTGSSFVYLLDRFPAPFGNELRAGPLEACIAFLFSAVSLCSLAGGLRDVGDDLPDGKQPFYYLMQNLMTGAMLAVVYANDVFTVYIFIEILMISACSLITAKRGGPALVSAMNYLLMSLTGSSLLLFSIAILYGVTGHLLMPYIQTGVAALTAAGAYTLPLFMLTGLMTAAIAIKSALFPFHSWLPGAHANAMSPASAVLSGVVIKCSLFLLIKLELRVFDLEIVRLLGTPWLLLIFGAGGVLYGSCKAIVQRDIKRMLSYASIVHVGFICTAISINTPAALAAACFHIMVHSTVKAMLFTAAGGLAAVSDHRKDFGALRGSARRDPLAGAAFLIGGLAMVGIPPLPGFASKLYLAQAALESPFAIPVITVSVVAATILSAMYYYPAIACIFSRQDGFARPNAGMDPSTSLLYRASLTAFMAMALFLGLFSQPVIRVIEKGLAVF